jgi:hypothetical protein
MELAELAAEELPLALVAVTSTRTVLLTSAQVRVYVEYVAPGIFGHPELLALQRCHW